MNKAVILDRDGTIIIDKIYLNDPNGIEYLPGALDALKILTGWGYKLVVVTNQSGLARGLVSLKNLDLIHEKMQAEAHRQGFGYAGFYYAPYTAEVPHLRRKPMPGLLLEAGIDHNLDLSRSFMIGDRITDAEAGKRAGCKTIWLVPEPQTANSWCDFQCADLTQALPFIRNFTEFPG